jgi:geranylgeranyl diphosphate synthase type I
MAERIRVYGGAVADHDASWDASWDGPGDATWDVAGFRAGVEDACQSFVAAQTAVLSPLGADASRLVEQARTSVTGGKRFRAAFCWWGYLAVAPPTDDRALLRACAALELLHASALVHDDYMDASDVRRGRPATHRFFAGEHDAAGWSGDAEQYGAAGAILLGDLLLAWSDELLRTCGLEAARVLDALTCFDLTRTEVIAGQFLDVSAQARGNSDVDVAMTVLRYKSAKYSIERPLQVGAALASPDRDVRRRLGRFGLPLGEAFQLRDDLLGVFGDPDVTGKPAGDDLREGKRTVLVALALEALSPAEAAELDAGLGTPLDGDQVDRLRTLVDRSGARERVEALISKLTDQALSALEAADIRPEAHTALRGLADAVTRREV